jgi:hypothetical protein
MDVALEITTSDNVGDNMGAAVIRETQGFSKKIFCFVIDRCRWLEAANYLAAPTMTISTVLYRFPIILANL